MFKLFFVFFPIASRRKYDPEPFEFMKNQKQKPDKKLLLKKEKKEKAVKKTETATEEKVKKEKIKNERVKNVKGQKTQKRKKPSRFIYIVYFSFLPSKKVINFTPQLM